MRKSPQVVDGLRNPLNSKPDQGEQEIPAEFVDRINAKRVNKRTEGMVKYQSRFRNFMTTVEVNDDITIGNKIVRGKNRHIRFENFQYSTNDPEIIQWLESQEFYGLGRTVWRESDKHELDLAIEAKKTISLMRQFDGTIDRLRPHMSAEDFDALSAVQESVSTQKAVLEP